MTSGLAGSLAFTVEAQSRCHMWPVAGLSGTGSTKGKRLPPHSGIVRWTAETVSMHTQPTCYENSQHNPRPVSQSTPRSESTWGAHPQAEGWRTLPTLGLVSKTQWLLYLTVKSVNGKN